MYEKAEPIGDSRCPHVLDVESGAAMVTPRCCGVQMVWMSEECRTNNCIFVYDLDKIYKHQGVRNIVFTY